jgi:hypothetical protein
MNSDSWARIFQDKKFLEATAKLSLFFGPGFMVIAYFKRLTFLELDWLKLLSLSALFSAVFVLPVMFTIWLLESIIPFRQQRKLKAVLKKSAQTKVDIQQQRTILEQISKEDLSEDERGEVARVGLEIDSMLASMDSTNEDATKAYEEIAEYASNKDVYATIQANWHLFALLFVQVLIFIGGDYFLHPTKRVTLYFLLKWLTFYYYLFMPLLLTGVWLVTFKQHLTYRRFTQRLIQIIGLILMPTSVLLLIIFIK